MHWRPGAKASQFMLEWCDCSDYANHSAGGRESDLSEVAAPGCTGMRRRLADSRTFTDDNALPKSLSSPADQEDRVNRTQHLRQQAAGLRLENTVMGSTPRALINGADGGRRRGRR